MVVHVKWTQTPPSQNRPEKSLKIGLSRTPFRLELGISSSKYNKGPWKVEWARVWSLEPNSLESMSLSKKPEPMQGVHLVWAWYTWHHHGLGLLRPSLMCPDSRVRPKPNMPGSKQHVWTHFLPLICLSSACLGPSSAPKPTFTSHELRLSHPSPTCLGPGSIPEPTFTSHGLKLWCTSLACLGPGSALIPTFTFNGLGHLAWAQHSSCGSLSILYWSNTYYFE